MLQATGASIDEFVALLSQKKGRRPDQALAGHRSRASGRRRLFRPPRFSGGSGWDEIPFPNVNDEHAYALEISGHSLGPLYRKGDIIVVSPAAPIRKGDRVVMKTKKTAKCARWR